jgi:hypothetical protein
MRIQGATLFALSCGILLLGPIAAPAQVNPVGAITHTIYSSSRPAERGDPMSKSNLSYHGGPTITLAKVVFIFWGSPFCAGGSDRAYATTLQSYRNQLGTTGEYRTIIQYSGILLANLGLGSVDMFDCTNPPVNVTDDLVRAKVNTYISANGFNASAIYEVVLPSGSYSSDATGATSCGGPDLEYCAYHGWIGSGAGARKYTVQPYPSCSACRRTGWSNVQNAERWVAHTTRATVTDPIGTGWWDNATGDETDDKCNWTPPSFLGTGGYGYQWEWSNLHGACIQTL